MPEADPTTACYSSVIQAAGLAQGECRRLTINLCGGTCLAAMQRRAAAVKCGRQTQWHRAESHKHVTFYDPKP